MIYTWENFYKEHEYEIESIIKKVKKSDFVPLERNIFRFMNKDLSDIKVIIIGQDPYHSTFEFDGIEYCVANGRSFQPDNLLSWNQPFRQVSLKNIVRLIHKNYNNIENYSDILKFKEISKQIDNGVFKIKQPNEWFDSLENQGVLFLNTYLTTVKHIANAHKELWEDFSKVLIQFISNNSNQHIVWFLWGSEAKKLIPLINEDKDVIYSSNHPMMCSIKNEDDFLKSNCFKDTMNIINWLG